MNCGYNLDGICEQAYNLQDDGYDREEVLMELEPDDETLCVHSDIDESLCPECGGQLEYREESRGEYWGAPAYERVAYCSRCGD